MAVRIRLRRTGKRNAPAHRIVVVDSRSPRDGRFIENIGFYDPRNGAESVDVERADYWISVGAQPSETVDDIIKRAKAGTALPPEEKKQEVAPTPDPAAPEEEKVEAAAEPEVAAAEPEAAAAEPATEEAPADATPEADDKPADA